MKVISLGWGVQSFTLAAMVALGELEPVDFAIHADTTHEFSGTYEFAARWTPWLSERGVRVVTVKNFASELGERAVVDIPAFTRSPSGDGQIKRQCTNDWKIAPMRRWLQANRRHWKITATVISHESPPWRDPSFYDNDEHQISKFARIKKWARRALQSEPVEQWLGISLDEFRRMKDSDVKYITNRWPLIEKRMTRADCEIWLIEHGLEIPPKSACTFCPFHNTAEWRKIKANPKDWQEAIEVDGAIRKARPPYDLFVHPSRKPLEDVDLRTAEEKGQLSLWDAECSGVCGV